MWQLFLCRKPQKEEAHTSPIKDSSNEKKVTSRLMMALSKNAHTLAVCMFSLRQALGKQAYLQGKHSGFECENLKEKGASKRSEYSSYNIRE